MSKLIEMKDKDKVIDVLEANNFNEHQIPRLLIVNPFVGLDEDIAEKAIALLNSPENQRLSMQKENCFGWRSDNSCHEDFCFSNSNV